MPPGCMLRIERIYLDWAIEEDGLFENGKWRLARANGCRKNGQLSDHI